MLITSRDITKKDYSWLAKTIGAGTEIFIYTGPTYGCCAEGEAYTIVNGQTPFFELLDSDVEEI